MWVTKKVLSFFIWICLFVLLSGLRVRFPPASPHMCGQQHTAWHIYNVDVQNSCQELNGTTHRFFNVKWNHTRLWSSDECVWVCEFYLHWRFQGATQYYMTIPHFPCIEHDQNLTGLFGYKSGCFWNSHWGILWRPWLHFENKIKTFLNPRANRHTQKHSVRKWRR